MPVLPTGTVTFLLTDVEGSTRLWEAFPEEMAEALERHDTIVRGAIEERGGVVFSTAGDAFAAAFDRVGLALEAAAAMQRGLQSVSWRQVTIRIRIGLHLGEAQERRGDYFGPTVNRTARIMAAAHGGQVLVSSAVAEVATGHELIDLGEHQLKDLSDPEAISQLVADGSDQSFPPLRTLNTVRHNLPVQKTELLGRAEEVTRVASLLDDWRLVTLTGPGGVGKTRLAVAAAAESSDRYPHGAFLVDLTPLATADQLHTAVAEVLGVRANAADHPGLLGEQLVGFLADRHLLLVLDNCEHLVDDCADFVDAMLATATESRVLATSRESLDLDGERSVRVASLATEDAGDGRPGAAVALVVQRAQAIGAMEDPSPENLQDLAAVCRELDGIPLAIELAAAQLAIMSPGQLRSRLGQRFELLAGGRRRRQRQQTLQATMDWSWELLNDEERAVLAQLAVFVGGFDLQAVETVCQSPGTSPIAHLLRSLVNKSLVAVGEIDGLARYRLLETTRLYALQRLVDSGVADQVRDRHVRWLQTLLAGQDLEDRWASLDTTVDYVREQDNIRAATDWALASGDSEGAAVLAYFAAPLPFLGVVINGSELLGRVRMVLEADTSPSATARLLVALAFLECAVDPAAAESTASAAAEAAIVAEDPFAVATSHACREAFRRRVDQKCWEEALAIAQAALAGVDAPQVAHFVRSFMLNNPGYPWTERKEVIRRVLAEPSGKTVPWSRLSDFHNAVGAALAEGDLDSAVRAADGIDRLREHYGIRHNWTESLNRALIAARNNDLDAVAAHLTDTLEALRSSGADTERADLLLVAAVLAEQAGDHQRTAQLLRAIREHPVPLGSGALIVMFRQLRSNATQGADRSQPSPTEGPPIEVKTEVDKMIALANPQAR